MLIEETNCFLLSGAPLLLLHLLLLLLHLLHLLLPLFNALSFSQKEIIWTGKHFFHFLAERFTPVAPTTALLMSSVV